VEAEGGQPLTLHPKTERRQRGQSLAETAIMVPILLILVFGVVEFSMAFRAYTVLTNATREGARNGAIGATAGSYPSDCSAGTATIVGKTCANLTGLSSANVTGVSVSYPNGNKPGQKVVVTTNYTYHYFTPVGGLIHFFSGGALQKTIDLKSSTTMRIE
jgi:Flp pilus assembly protein TadG